MYIEYLSLSKKSFFEKYGLGDLISIVYCLENLGKQKNILFIIKIDNNLKEFYKNLFNYLNFKNIILENKNEEKDDLIKKIYNFSYNNKKCKCKLGLFNGCFFICCLSNFLIKEYEFNPLRSNPIFGLKKIENKKLTLVQFDKRSKHLVKSKYSKIEIKSLLKKENSFYCIGGKETTNYIENAQYMLGDIDFLIKKMNNCKKFIGTDSGMSHLAGMMGINSIIYLKNDLGCIANYYINCYRNSKILHKSFRIF